MSPMVRAVIVPRQVLSHLFCLTRLPTEGQDRDFRHIRYVSIVPILRSRWYWVESIGDASQPIRESSLHAHLVSFVCPDRIPR